MESYTKNRMDKLPCCPSSETSTEFNTKEDNEEITERQSMKNHIEIDVRGHDEVLPCSDETSTAESDQKLLWEIIHGLQKHNPVLPHQDSAGSSETPCIYKVEQNLNEVHEQSTFHPKLVSIGPFHLIKISAEHVNISAEHLKPMEDHKWKSLSDFLKSMNLTSGSGSGSNNATTSTDDDGTIVMTKKKQCLVASMQKLETQAKHKLVSIGPFHHNISAEHLKPMEEHKRRSLSDFLKPMNLTNGSGNDNIYSNSDIKKIQCLIASMQKLEAKARACYSETFDNLDSNKFVKMLVLDGCFIIQLLLGFHKQPKNEADSLFSWRSRLPNLRHDLLLLENQLPFVVLEQIFAMPGINEKGYQLRNLILDFFNPVLPRKIRVLDRCKKVKPDGPCLHLLELFMSSFQRKIPNKRRRIFGLPNQQRDSYSPKYPPNDDLDQDMWIHCVTKLREAGVEFKQRDHHDLLDIEFKNGRLHIPPLFIDGNTVHVLLNFIAYEQRHQPLETPYFTSYLMFLDYLVNSSKDVEHLYYKGIINHGLGSDEQAATLFNKLCKEVVLEFGDRSNNFLSPVFKEVNKYSRKRRNRWWASWKNEYFRTPWVFSSFLAAIVLLVLTFLQTFCSMYACFRPP